MSPEHAVLGIEGGATRTTALLLDGGGRVLARAEAGGCNAFLHSSVQIEAVLAGVERQIKKFTRHAPVAVGCCVAGVIDDRTRGRVERAARRIWPGAGIFVSHDLVSGLYGGLGRGEGIVVIAGTGACVFGMWKGRAVKAGGWGHILGDPGSGYFVAHQGLRRAVEYYDLHQRFDGLGARLMRALCFNDVTQLARWAASASKADVARLAPEVFAAAREGHRGAQGIIRSGAAILASDALGVRHLLRAREDLPLCLWGGIFLNHFEYARTFSRQLRRIWPSAQIRFPKYDGATGAALWTRQKLEEPAEGICQRGSVVFEPAVDEPDLEGIATEERNSRTAGLSAMSIPRTVELMLREEARVVPAVLKRKRKIARAVEMTARALKKGGRLIYVGAGTSGRLGVLDASECPPTFGVDAETVQGVIAGGAAALSASVEGAEDDPDAGAGAIRARNVTARDVVCGISASGRTPFVLGALNEARRAGAHTLLVCCNPSLPRTVPVKVDILIGLATGPEAVAGSTRLKAGTATKIVLNILSTLTMVRLGKISDHFMVDVRPVNAKLRARAVRMVMTLARCNRERARAALEKAGWNVRRAVGWMGEGKRLF